MTRISALASLASADPTDVLPIVDVSATTTKKITKAALLASVYDGTDIAAQAITSRKVDLSVANDAARTALTSPFEGLEVYQKDTDATYIYDGSAWRKQAQWEELGKTTLSGTSTTLGVTGFAARKRLRVLAMCIPSGSIATGIRCNNDSASNYSYRYEQDGGATTAATAQNFGVAGTTGVYNQFIVADIINFSAYAKGMTVLANTYTDLASAAPSSINAWNKWANTSTQITRLDIFTSTNNFASGSEIIILGKD